MKWYNGGMEKNIKKLIAVNNIFSALAWAFILFMLLPVALGLLWWPLLVLYGAFWIGLFLVGWIMDAFNGV